MHLNDDLNLVSLIFKQDQVNVFPFPLIFFSLLSLSVAFFIVGSFIIDFTHCCVFVFLDRAVSRLGLPVRVWLSSWWSGSPRRVRKALLFFVFMATEEDVLQPYPPFQHQWKFTHS